MAGDRSLMRAEGPGRIRLVSCVGVELELALLPHFLTHYLALGIEPRHVHVILNAEDPGSPRLSSADRILADHGVAPGTRWISTYTSDAMWQERRALQERVSDVGDWIVNADVDELHRYPAPLDDVASYLDAGGFGAVQGVMIDRLSSDGTLADVLPEPSLPAQFPVRADVSLSVIGTGVTHDVAGTTKLMMHRGDVFPNRGGHTAIGAERHARYAAGARLSVFPGAGDAGWRADVPFQVDHYKWTATLRQSLARRLSARGVSAAGREYGNKIDRYLTRHDRIRLEDAAILPPMAAQAADWRGWLARMRRTSLYWKARNAAQHKLAALGRLMARRVTP